MRVLWDITSAQELDQLLDVFIQQLEVKVMNSSYKDSWPHLVQDYCPLHHSSDDYGLENFGTFLVMHIIALPIIESLQNIHLGRVLSMI